MKIDKQKFEILEFSDFQKKDSIWKSKSVNQRIAAIEMLRQINYGYDPTTERLQRLFEVAEFPQS